MKKIQNKKGFTLAELLIVMAIILILAAIAIPNFTKQLEASRETADINAIRAAYSEAMSDYMLNKPTGNTVTINDVKITQKTAGWAHVSTSDLPFTGLATYQPTAGTYNLVFTFTESSGSTSCSVSAGS